MNTFPSFSRLVACLVVVLGLADSTYARSPERAVAFVCSGSAITKDGSQVQIDPTSEVQIIIYEKQIRINASVMFTRQVLPIQREDDFEILFWRDTPPRSYHGKINKITGELRIATDWEGPKNWSGEYTCKKANKVL